MSLINRQNQNINMPAIIETPSSIWMQGQEHDASTLTPLFGKQFHYIHSNVNTNGTIYTKYSGVLGACTNNSNHTDRANDYLAFNLEDFNRGMKDVNGYQWNDGFNYYTMEYGGYRMWKFNPSNQNLTYGLVNRPNAATDYAANSWTALHVHENFILDEDSTNVYLMSATHRNQGGYSPYFYNNYGNETYRRMMKEFVYFSKSTLSVTNDTSLLSDSSNGYHAYIGRSSTRIFVFRSLQDQTSTQLSMYTKSTNTVTTVQSLSHSGSHTPIPSETFQIDTSGSFGFYHTQVVPNGVPSGSSNPKHQIQRIIFNKDGSQASGSSGPSVVAYNTNCTVDYSASGSLSPNDLWPNSWTTNTQRYFTRRSKLFLHYPTSGSAMYLIAFNITPYGYEDTNKNYYNALVFETHPTASANLTYRSYRPIYNDLGGEIRAVIAMDSNTNRFLVVTTNNMAIYTFDTSSKTLTLAQTIPGEFRHYGVDTYGRLWGTTYANDLFSFTLDSPVRINISSPTASYSYSGTSISSSVNVEARNYLGSYVAVPTRLTIEGTSATFTSNGLSYIDVTTSTGSLVNVPITITNGGFTRIVASSNF
jgi:hypothetical protein